MWNAAWPMPDGSTAPAAPSREQQALQAVVEAQEAGGDAAGNIEG
jgi:hypothetical protein